MNGSSNDTPIYVSIEEACRLTSLGRSSIYKLIKDGVLTRCKVGTRSLILRSSLEALTEAH